MPGATRRVATLWLAADDVAGALAAVEAGLRADGTAARLDARHPGWRLEGVPVAGQDPVLLDLLLHLPSDQLNSDRLPGDQLSGDQLPGDQLPGDDLPGQGAAPPACPLCGPGPERTITHAIDHPPVRLELTVGSCACLQAPAERRLRALRALLRAELGAPAGTLLATLRLTLDTPEHTVRAGLALARGRLRA
jgi:hypothetical protein